jgi:hypothetical protein
LNVVGDFSNSSLNRYLAGPEEKKRDGWDFVPPIFAENSFLNESPMSSWKVFLR